MTWARHIEVMEGIKCGNSRSGNITWKDNIKVDVREIGWNFVA